mgnify:CR=1 FL=1|tara:strand:- start:838 stop:3279 length:2442 start_codon:yes stop_codon:yes gene_type:complete
MKNKLLTFFLISFFCLSNLNQVLAEEFIFKVSDIEITENGNVYKGNNRGTIKTNNQLELISNNFEYLKKINQLEANGDVQLFDLKNDITINAQKIFYLKNEEKIFTLGKTLIKISDKYNVVGYDLILLRDKMILSSKEKTVITDNQSNIYKLEEFQYSINKEILKGKNITFTTNNKKEESDEYFFKTGFFSFKENKFLAKNISANLHKSLFGNNENDPRVNAVSGYGDEFNSYYNKGVFTSCKKTDKCPPWKITSNKIHHNKIKKQIIYKNAWLEIYDFPVFYFPKFFHPDPTVKRQSGFLSPELGSGNGLGDSVYTPYFFVISDEKDLTVKPRLFDDNKFLLQNEYRQKTKNSLTIADFGFINGHNSSTQDKGGTRSHLFTSTIMDLSLDNYLHSTLKIDYQKTTNDNYLKLFNLKSPLPLQNDVLESFIKLNLSHERYDLTTSMQMYERLKGSNSDRYSYALPNYDLVKNFNLENIDGSFNFNSTGSNTLNNTNILSTTMSNDLNYTSLNYFLDNGIKSNFEVSLKNINTMGKNNPMYKNTPQSELASAYFYNASLPLTKKNDRSFNTLEPKLSLRFSPHDMKNNSGGSRRIEINNIFASNRLALGDSFEAGESVTLGINFKKEKINITEEITQIEEYIDFKLASVFRLSEEKNIPIATTLNKKTSNIFGKFKFKPIKNISFDYDFSLTNDLNTLEYNSFSSNINFMGFSTRFDYLEERGVVGQKHVLKNSTTYVFNKQNSIFFNTRKDQKLNLTEYYDLVYEYKNDCLVAGIKYKKNYYNDGDIKPSEELFFSITIVPLTTFSPDKIALK